MDNQQNKTPRRQKKALLGVFDVFIIIALVACVVAAGFAFVFKRNNGEALVAENEKEEFAITFECNNIAQFHARLLKDGDMYYLPDNSDFGKLSGNVTITPAVVYAQRSDGTFVRTYAPENGDDTKVDVSGTVIVKGVRDSNGILKIGNNFEAVPGHVFIMHSSTVAVQVNITAVEKVSK